ncbi:substrate-binding domain-containing protein [Ignisphaera sp. 4213-co]|uniref:Substrate-binding domain-containing protein n=1 Tax=Ignisphaera cupida TaxID=3050454 RepID=A0ABD4ZA58_9CREN|nr:substrate-binding domain-containing protein [Ignisphaera sp. 4213-co]MDK6029185.1 substrate-binding domain-containing protein [Ignisphaera sp. 4213-co]
MSAPRAISRLVVFLVVGIIIGVLIGYFAGYSMAPSAPPTTIIRTVEKTVTQTIGTTVTVTTGPQAVKEIKLALFVVDFGHPYFKGMAAGAQRAVEYFQKIGLPVTMDVFDAKNDPATQVSQIETAIGKGYTVLLVNPITYEAAEPALRKAKDAKIPVFTLDRDVADKTLRIAFVGTDNVAAAEVEARYFLKTLESRGYSKPWKIVILNGLPGASSAEERKKGFHNVLDPLVQKGEVQIVYEDYADFRSDTAYSKMQSLLARTRDIHGVIAANDEMILGAIKALRDAGLKPCEQVVTFGFDAISAAVEATKEGTLCGTIGQAAFLQGYWGVLAAVYHVLYGWNPPTDWIKTPVVPVMKENIDWFGYVISTPISLPVIPIEPYTAY